MVKTFLNRWIFELPWSSVTLAWIQKYPNAHSLQIDEVDTIDRRLDKETGSFHIRRLISASLSPPKWMQAIGFPSYAYVLEEAIINPHSKEMTIRSINITGSELLEIEEICTYSEEIELKNNKKKPVTLYKQKAIIESKVPLLHTPIEAYAIGVQAGNAEKGLSAMKQISSECDSVGSQGLLQILEWRLDTILLLNDLSSLRVSAHQGSSAASSLSFWKK